MPFVIRDKFVVRDAGFIVADTTDGCDCCGEGVWLCICSENILIDLAPGETGIYVTQRSNCVLCDDGVTYSKLIITVTRGEVPNEDDYRIQVDPIDCHVCLCEEVASLVGWASFPSYPTGQPNKQLGYFWDTKAMPKVGDDWQFVPVNESTSWLVECSEGEGYMSFSTNPFTLGRGGGTTDISCCRPVAIAMAKGPISFVIHEGGCPNTDNWSSSLSCDPVICESINPIWTGNLILEGGSAIPIACAVDIYSFTRYHTQEGLPDPGFIADFLSDSSVPAHPVPPLWFFFDSRVELIVNCDGSGLLTASLDGQAVELGALFNMNYSKSFGAGYFDLTAILINEDFELPLISSFNCSPPASVSCSLILNRGC